MQPKPKRFYTEVTLVESKDGFEVQLDGRTLKTVAKQRLLLKQKHRANLVVAEWRAVENVIEADAMPATRIANIAIDRLAIDRAAITDDLMMYAETDLLCHRAKEDDLRARQMERWDPPLRFLEQSQGIRMVVTTGVLPVLQPQSSLDALRALLDGADAETFSALAMLIPILGSILLAVALWKKGITLEAAIAACQVDEEYQQEPWGKDAEIDVLWETKLRDVRVCAVWLG